jgi:hypothetical protein
VENSLWKMLSTCHRTDYVVMMMMMMMMRRRRRRRKRRMTTTTYKYPIWIHPY